MIMPAMIYLDVLYAPPRYSRSLPILACCNSLREISRDALPEMDSAIQQCGLRPRSQILAKDKNTLTIDYEHSGPLS